MVQLTDGSSCDKSPPKMVDYSFLLFLFLKLENKRNKAVYTTAPVAGGWAGAVMSWAGAVMSWAGA